MSFVPPITFDVDVNAANFKAGMEGVNNTLKQTASVADKTSKSFGGMTKSAERATSAVRALSLIKTLFVAYGVKEILELQNAYNSLGAALANVGISTDETRARAKELAESYKKLGFDSAAAANGLSTLVTATGDLAKSERMLGIAANYARAQHVSLDDASRLVLSASRGNLKVFNQFGITLDTTVSKTKALEKAMGELETRLKDRAKNATNDLSVQVQILKNQLMGFVETVAAYVMPWVSKFVSGIIAATEWIKEHKKALAIVAGILSTLVLTAIVNVTRALYAQAAAWVAANWEIAAIVAVILAAAAAFVYLWNKFKGFRDGVVAYVKNLVVVWTGLAKIILMFAETAVMAFSLAMNAFLIFVRGTANAQIALGKLFHNEEMQKRGKETLDWIDSANKGVTDFGNKIVETRGKIDKFATDLIKTLDSFKDVKIDLSKFKMPKFDIPKFTNGKPITEGIPDDIKAGLDKGLKHIADFNEKLKTQFTEIGKTFASIVTRNFNKEIMDKIGDPIDQVIYDAQNAINKYYAASNAYKGATENLTKAQNNYIAALQTGNQTLIDGAESALTKAEDATSKVYDTMGQTLSDLYDLQSQMIQKVADLYSEISKLEEDRTKVLESAEKDRVELLAEYNKEKAKLQKDYDTSVLKAEQEAAKRRAEIVQQSVDLLRNAYRTATYRSVGDIYQGLTYEGRYIKGGTTEKILKALGLQGAKAKTLAQDAATLAGLGFSQEFIQEVIAQGPDIGHKLAQTIINSTPAQVAEMRRLWDELNKTSLHGVDSVAQSLNTGITLATEELTKQLAQVDIDLNATLKDLQVGLTQSLAESFDTYAKSLERINTETAKQILAIDTQIAQLRAKIDALKSALAGIATISSPGSGGTAPNIIPRAETTEEEGIATSCLSGRGIFKVVKLNGVIMSRTLISCVAKKDSTDGSTTTDSTESTDPHKGKYYNYYTGEWVDDPSLIKPRTSTTSTESIVPDTTSSGFPSTFTVGNKTFTYGVGTVIGAKPDDTASETMARQKIADIFATITGQGLKPNVTINVTANTNATSQDIADDVGWAVRTSGDVQYRTTGRGKMVYD